MYLRLTQDRTVPADVDAVVGAVPAVVTAIRNLPGCRDVRTGIDRSTGRSVAVSSFDTAEDARFARETIGEPLRRLTDAGWQAEPSEVFEAVESVVRPGVAMRWPPGRPAFTARS